MNRITNMRKATYALFVICLSQAISHVTTQRTAITCDGDPRDCVISSLEHKLDELEKKIYELDRTVANYTRQSMRFEEYMFEVKVGRDIYAESNSPLIATLYGERGHCDDLLLRPPSNKFATDSTEELTVYCSHNLGVLRLLKLDLKGMDDIQLERVTVRDLTNDVVYTFPCGFSLGDDYASTFIRYVKAAP